MHLPRGWAEPILPARRGDLLATTDAEETRTLVSFALHAVEIRRDLDEAESHHTLEILKAVTFRCMREITELVRFQADFSKQLCKKNRLFTPDFISSPSESQIWYYLRGIIP